MGSEAEELPEEELSEEEVKAVAEEVEEAAFNETFEGKEPVPVEDEPKEEDVAEEETAQETEDVVEEENPLAVTVAEMQKTIRQMQGKNGELNARLLDLAKKEKEAETPSKKQLDEAMDDGEKLAFLKNEFPEYFEGIKEAGELIKADILGEIPDNKEDFERLREELKSDYVQSLGIGMLDFAHKGWQDTVKTDEFKAFAYEGGPTEVELGIYNVTETEKAAIMFNDWIDKYPEWGQKHGVLLQSDNISDVTKMLDQYEDSKAAQEEEGKKDSKKDRLRKNVAATKSSSVHQPQKAMTEQEAFDAQFE